MPLRRTPHREFAACAAYCRDTGRLVLAFGVVLVFGGYKCLVAVHGVDDALRQLVEE